MLTCYERELYRSLIYVIDCGRKYGMVGDENYHEFKNDPFKWIMSRCYNRRLYASRITINALVVYSCPTMDELVSYLAQYQIHIRHQAYIGPLAYMIIRNKPYQVRYDTGIMQKIKRLDFINPCGCWRDTWDGRLVQISYMGIFQILMYIVNLEFRYDKFNKALLNLAYHTVCMDEMLLE